METFIYKGKPHKIYRYSRNLEFFFVDDEEKRFLDLLQKYKRTENIPSTELMQGLFFNEGTREINPIYVEDVNKHIYAQEVICE